MGIGALKKIGTVLTLASAFAQIEELNKKGAPMKKYLPIITTVAGTLSAALAFPSFVEHHTAVYAALAAAAQILHAVLPGLFSGSSQN